MTIETRDQVHFFHQVEPLSDPRWKSLVARHPHSSIFHTAGWLEALRHTYGFEPVVYSTYSANGDLQDAVPLCRVDSWLTGKRLVSLPFSDHCDLLLQDSSAVDALRQMLLSEVHRDGLGYCELRPLRALLPDVPSPPGQQSYVVHQLDLNPDLDTLLKNCHKDSTQRKIARGVREGLRIDEDHPWELLDVFYRLMVLTRRRHGVPPQPKVWFENLVRFLGDDLRIRVASKNEQPVAAILTLRHKGTLIYKYGCSDPRFNNLGGTQSLFWRAIQEAKAQGLTTFDLGRTAIDNQGLLTFKDRWGAARLPLSYCRLSGAGVRRTTDLSRPWYWRPTTAANVVRRLPIAILPYVGTLLYKHTA